MYLAGVSVRRVEDITEALWGTRVSAGTVSRLNQKTYSQIDEWRQRPLEMSYPYVYLGGIYLKRNFAGNFENAAILIAMAVNEEGEREVVGACEGLREDKESWLSLLCNLKERGLRGTQLFIGDKCLRLLDAVHTTYPDARYQRCSVHFTRNVLSVVPRGQMKLVAAMLRAIHAQEDRQAAIAKSKDVIAKPREMEVDESGKEGGGFGR